MMTHASRPSTLSTLGEFGLIRKLEKHCQTLNTNVIQGIGDDAAILQTSPKESLIASKDLAIEGIHFDLRFEKPKDCLLYTSPSPRDATLSRMPSSA